MGKHIPITDIEKEEVIALFLSMENNTYKEISKLTGIRESRIKKITDNHYKKWNQ